MRQLLSSARMIYGFKEHTEKDFLIRFLGYDDFHVIEPLKTPRSQNIYTLHFVLHGSGRMVLNGKERRIREHDVFFVPPQVMFCYYPDDDNPWEYLWFEFDGEHAPLYAEAAGFGDGVFVKPCGNGAEFYSDAVRLLKQAEKQKSVGYYDAMSLFYRLLACNSENERTRETDYADIAAAYVRGHYYDPELSVKRICAEVGISHTYMCRLFKEKYGMTLKKYLIQARIAEAARLLKSTDLSVKEIAFAVGFGDYPNFLKAFRENRGISPTTWRLQNDEIVIKS